MKLKDIKISKAFKKNPPSRHKIDKFRRFYEIHGYIDKPLVLNRANILVDGYARYVMLRECGEQETEQITYQDDLAKYRTEETMYVFAFHTGVNKEFVWRVPAQRTDLQDLKVGDEIFVQTRYGRKRVVISRIDKTIIPPVVQPIKKVICKCED